MSDIDQVARDKAAAVRKAEAKEREACAGLADREAEFATEANIPIYSERKGARQAALNIAAAIRARGGKGAPDEDSAAADPDPIRRWFGLSYAQYLTVPRSVLQSMGIAWQEKFVALLEELDETIDWRSGRGRYRVTLCEVKEDHHEDEKRLLNQWGRELYDPLADYERGRRQIPHKER